MKKCDPRAFAKCPYREMCGDISNALFADGSECDEFNEKVIEQPMTNSDRIRAMSNEELAKAIEARCTYNLCEIVCGNSCNAFSKNECLLKILDWLQQPAKEKNSERKQRA